MSHVTTGDIRHCIDGSCRCDEIAQLRRKLKKVIRSLNIEKSLNVDLSQKLEQKDKLLSRAAELLRSRKGLCRNYR